MVNSLNFTAQTRTLLGKKSNKLVKQNQIPANIYGAGIESQALAVDAGAFAKLHDKAGDNALIYLTVDQEAKPRPVLVEDVAMNPVTGQLMHVVFRQVNLNETVEAEVPVELIGEFKVPDAVVVTVEQIVEVEALPTDIPEKFEIDISQLTEIDQSVTFADLVYDKSKVKLMVSEEEMNDPVVMVQAVQEEVEEAPAEAAAEGEAAPAPEGGEAPTPAAEEKAE